MSNETRPGLVDAALALAAVMRHAGSTLDQTADRLEAYDRQPYPFPVVLMSNRVVDFLRALAPAEWRETPPDGWADVRPHPSYGPLLRERSG
jgi:hypothetical protein